MCSQDLKTLDGPPEFGSYCRKRRCKFMRIYTSGFNGTVQQGCA